ncbi:hypothetical protein B0T26DRAFT_686033 [Lasiosphaeria miniovina]|uniref:Uncharacterized protein n=1 Tax=Lasiosphaeria miniovina TaxID=1954250 RepID=A0AA40EBG0_9PEZI|nr:uncharacterized protein B0T26DRAFT_686033 [Lasiosphaeria miniovina]KAK0733850.1 hypothetical protein B0T26DRAFT_686033 [Lasiosphaeria miniovina]
MELQQFRDSTNTHAWIGHHIPSFPHFRATEESSNHHQPSGLGRIEVCFPLHLTALSCSASVLFGLIWQEVLPGFVSLQPGSPAPLELLSIFQCVDMFVSRGFLPRNLLP